MLSFTLFRIAHSFIIVIMYLFHNSVTANHKTQV